MRYLTVLMMLLAALTVGACGDDDDVTPDDTSGVQVTTPAGFPTIAESAPQPPPPQVLDTELREAQDGVIEIAAEGSLFVGNRLAVPIDAQVTIRVTNNDATPHNLRVAGNDGLWETEDDAVTTPETIEGSAVGELSFAPPISGYFTFRCDFHPNTMGGQIVAGSPAAAPVTQSASPSPEPTESETPIDGEEPTE